MVSGREQLTLGPFSARQLYILGPPPATTAQTKCRLKHEDGMDREYLCFYALIVVTTAGWAEVSVT